MHVVCLKSCSGSKMNGQQFEFQEGRSYEVNDQEILEPQLRAGHLKNVSGAPAVETATAVSTPVKKRRGRPRKTDVRTDSDS